MSALLRQREEDPWGLTGQPKRPSKTTVNQPKPTKKQAGAERLGGLRALTRCFSEDWGKLGNHVASHYV